MATQEEKVLKKQRERRRGSSTPNSPQARAPSAPVDIRGLPPFASAVTDGDPVLRPPPGTPNTRRPSNPAAGIPREGAMRPRPEPGVVTGAGGRPESFRGGARRPSPEPNLVTGAGGRVRPARGATADEIIASGALDFARGGPSSLRGATVDEIIASGALDFDEDSPNGIPADAPRQSPRTVETTPTQGGSVDDFMERDLGGGPVNVPPQAQREGRQDILRQLNTDALDLDSAEVRARRAAGEVNPVGSAELAASEGTVPGGSNRFRDSLEGLPDRIPAQLAADILKDRGINVSVKNGRLVMPDNIGAQLGPEGSEKRALMQEIAFRAPGAAMFAEEASGAVPTFNNQSIRRREQAGMMPDFRALEQLERDRRASRPVSENLRADIARGQRGADVIAETERLERESARNLEGQAIAARGRNGRSSESGVSLFSRTRDGGFVPNNLTPKQVNSVASEVAPSIVAELRRTPAVQEQLNDGTLTPEQLQQDVQAEFGSFVQRYMNEAETAERLPFLSEQALADAFVIGRAVESASGGKVRSFTPTELVTTVEDLIANQETTLFGSDKSRTGGQTVKFDELGSGAANALRRLESEMIRQAQADPNSQVRRDIQARVAEDEVRESRAQDTSQRYDEIRQRNMQRDENFVRAMMPGFAEDFFDAPGGLPDVRSIVEGVNQYNPANRLLFEPVANIQSRFAPDSPRTTQARANLRRIATGEDEN